MLDVCLLNNCCEWTLLKPTRIKGEGNDNDNQKPIINQG